MNRKSLGGWNLHPLPHTKQDKLGQISRIILNIAALDRVAGCAFHYSDRAKLRARSSSRFSSPNSGWNSLLPILSALLIIARVELAPVLIRERGGAPFSINYIFFLAGERDDDSGSRRSHLPSNYIGHNYVWQRTIPNPLPLSTRPLTELLAQVMTLVRHTASRNRIRYWRAVRRSPSSYFRSPLEPIWPDPMD